MSTLPDGSTLAVWPERGPTMAVGPVAMKVPAPALPAASKISAFGSPVLPPTRRTLPDGSTLAVWPLRATTMAPVVAKVPAPALPAGSKTSALAPLVPPVRSTLPEGSTLAVCDDRAVLIDPAVAKVPAPALPAGSKTSAPAKPTTP